jgi:predicted transporter
MGDQDSLWNLDDPTLQFMWLGVFVTLVCVCFFIINMILDIIKRRKRMREVKMKTPHLQGLAGLVEGNVALRQVLNSG